MLVDTKYTGGGQGLGPCSVNHPHTQDASSRSGILRRSWFANQLNFPIGIVSNGFNRMSWERWPQRPRPSVCVQGLGACRTHTPRDHWGCLHLCTRCAVVSSHVRHRACYSIRDAARLARRLHSAHGAFLALAIIAPTYRIPINPINSTT